MLVICLWQNIVKVYFDVIFCEDGCCLIYGGYVISMVCVLFFNGLVNVQIMVVLNGGVYVNFCFVGDMIWVWFEVLEKVEIEVLGIVVIWLWLVVYKGVVGDWVLLGMDGKYVLYVLLDLDYWVLILV